MKKRPASLPFWPSSLPCRCAKLLQCIWLIATLWTIAHQAPLPMGSSRQEYWSRLPYPPPGNLPDPGIEPVSHKSPALANSLFTASATWEAPSFSCSWLNLSSSSFFTVHIFLIPPLLLPYKYINLLRR